MIPKTVIVTGAANGIGLAIVERCLRDGFRVLACDTNVEGVEQLESIYSNKDFFIQLADVSDKKQTRAFFDQIRDKEEPSFLVNNAGVYLGKSILEYSAEDIQRVIAVNCLGAVYFSQHFAKLLLPAHQSGSIVNMASVAGQEGSADAIYGLSKAGLIGLTKSCARNFAPHIRVNAIAPGLVSTELIRKVPSWRVDEYRKGELLKEPILAEDVAETVAFLLSERSKHYTGAVFDINNGQYRR